jgi:hypothetical protein
MRGTARAHPARMRLTYLVPIRARNPAPAAFFDYLSSLSAYAQVILVDGSSSDVYDVHTARCDDSLTHVPVDADVAHYRNGKVAGVMTGLRRASFEHVVIADDDVRYEAAGLQAIARQLEAFDIVRPQNYFDPLPWHCWIDTARTLVNRMTGGDWPGTLGVRRTSLLRAGGYDGDVLFENLELIRTVVAAGGRQSVPLDLYVRREPPTSRHFWAQRVRQAYDEFARPTRMAVWLSVGPLLVTAVIARGWWWLVGGVVLTMMTAETGRRRRGGTTVFPFVASLAAPVWVAERAVSAWLALAAFAIWGGVPYRGRILSRAATPMRILQHRAGTRSLGLRTDR